MKDWIYACGSAGNALVERLYMEFAAENLLLEMTTEEDLWQGGPLIPDLPFDRVDVWRIPLNRTPSRIR